MARSTAKKTLVSYRKSKNCWILVFAPLLPKMAVTSRSTDLNAGGVPSDERRMCRVSILNHDAEMGIENLLRHYIPEVTEVRPVGL